MYNSTLSLTSTLDEVDGYRYAPGRFLPGKETPYPLYRMLGGPQGLSGHVRKIFPLKGFEPRTVQPVPGRCTDYAVAAHPERNQAAWYFISPASEAR
jgi:hypothetical protein